MTITWNGDEMREDPQDWYFTFGAGQEHDGKYVVVKNSNAHEARAKMIGKYGIAWCGQYTVPVFMQLELDKKMTWLEDID